MTLQRVFQDRHLTPDEIAEDAAIRQKIEQEFPPKVGAIPVQSDSLSDLLRRSIQESGRTIEEIAGDSGISPAVIAGFISRTRDIHMTTADRLARSLGLNKSSTRPVR
jgi:hypothetical protein